MSQKQIDGCIYSPACCAAGGKGLRQNLTPQAQRALIRQGSKRAEALEALTQQVTELQSTLQAERGSKEVSAAKVRQVEQELTAAQNSLKAERLLLQKVPSAATLPLAAAQNSVKADHLLLHEFLPKGLLTCSYYLRQLNMT